MAKHPMDALPSGQKLQSWPSLATGSVQRYGLPPHPTATALNRAAILQMQHRYGNMTVQRYLASLASQGHQAVQRQTKPEKTKAGMALGSKAFQFKADLSLSSDGKLQLDLGPALDLKYFGLATKAALDPTGVKAVGEMQLGGKGHYVAPKVVISPGGKATLELGHRFARDLFTVASTLKSDEDKLTVGHSLGWSDPFGAERFDVSASLHYRVDDPAITGAKLGVDYRILGTEAGKTAPYLMLTFEGSYTAPGPRPGREEAKVMLLLRGAL